MKKNIFLALMIHTSASNSFSMQPYQPPMVYQPPSYVLHTPRGVTSYTPGILVSKKGSTVKFTKSDNTEWAHDERPYPLKCSTYKPDVPIDGAIAFGKADLVEEYYSNWHGYFPPSEYHSSIAKSLLQAAQLPHEKTSKIVTYLLKKIKKEFIEDQVDCLLIAALNNGHTQIIEFIDKSFAYPHVAWAFYDANVQNKPRRIKTVLEAGVSPTTGIGTFEQPQAIVHDDPKLEVHVCEHAHYPLHLASSKGHGEIVRHLLQHNASPVSLDHKKRMPLDVALLGFNAHDKEHTTQQRLFTVRQLLTFMPEAKRPAPYEINKYTIPQETRARLRKIFEKLQLFIPRRISMNDEAKTPVVKPHIKNDIIEKEMFCGAICCVCSGIIGCICKNAQKANKLIKPKTIKGPRMNYIKVKRK